MFNEREREMFYLTMHSTHFIYGYMVSDIWLRTILIVRKEGRKEGNVLFNDALNTFYLRLYGVRYMVKDHSDSEKGNPRMTDTKQLHPSCTACRRTANLPGLA